MFGCDIFGTNYVKVLTKCIHLLNLAHDYSTAYHCILLFVLLFLSLVAPMFTLQEGHAPEIRKTHHQRRPYLFSTDY